MKITQKIYASFSRLIGQSVLTAALATVLASLVLLPTMSVLAANPVGGTLNSTGPNVTWMGTGAGPAAPNGETDCTTLPTAPCDEFKLTIGGVESDWINKRARVQINWLEPATDYDMYIYKGTTATGSVVASSANGTTTFEQAEINPSSTGVGLYTVRVVYFAATVADQYSGIASAVAVPAPFTPPASACIIPTYNRHNPPTTLTGYNTAGEPSVGINWNTGNVMFQSNTSMLRATFNDATSPATTIWKRFNPMNQATSLDPILATDPVTGRTIPGQLIAAGGTSLTAITDNDGETFTPNVTTGITSGVDHQTIGAGPYHANTLGIGPTTSYPNAWYYASQDIGAATATRSDNGGLSYGPAVPMYNLVQCSGLHGHVKVAPDGTVYVPNKNCPDPDMNAATLDGGQGFAVSEDNGTTWTVRTLPGSGSGDNDPAVSIGAGGRVFFNYTGSDKHIRAAVSDDKGRTWKYDQDLGLSTSTPNGAAYNLTATVFPSATAGDNDRAALFFLGTSSTLPGDPTGTDAGTIFAGTWYPYVATTCNGGMSYSVVRADDVVQQGVVCTNGTTCPSGTRNLLDFNDIQVDRFGRAVPGYADGCNTPACLAAVNGTKAQNDGLRIATLLRQSGGSRLFSDFDAGGPTAPALSPPVEVSSASRGGTGLVWLTPDDSGSPITAYRIYRGIGNNEAEFVQEVGAAAHSFLDRKGAVLTGKAGRERVYYQVTVLNAYGESPRTVKFYPGQTFTAKAE